MKLSARKELRRERLQRLVDDRFEGKNVALANAAGIDPTLVLAT